jgi:hypothetical protein
MRVNLDYFATAITNTVEALDQTVVLRLSAEHRGIAVFPECDQTVVSPLLLQCHWNERCIQAHWAPRYGLGVGAYINLGDFELQSMENEDAKNSEFENRFEEALADPTWVATRAECARAELLSRVTMAALLMQRAWEKAQEIPVTRPGRRWRATSILELVFGTSALTRMD